MTVHVAYSPDKKRTTNVYERRRTDIIFFMYVWCPRAIRCSVRGALYGDVTITGEGIQNLGLCSALRAVVYRASGPRFIWSHPKDRPIQSLLTIHKGIWRIYSNPDPHGFTYYMYLYDFA
jgi:hypothetical protein